jgi:hypothetical protein
VPAALLRHQRYRGGHVAADRVAGDRDAARGVLGELAKLVNYAGYVETGGVATALVAALVVPGSVGLSISAS